MFFPEAIFGNIQNSILCFDFLIHTFWRHEYLICIIQKSWISLERDKVWQKGKHHSSLLKALQFRLFFNTSIFHFIGTLTLQNGQFGSKFKILWHKGKRTMSFWGYYFFTYHLNCIWVGKKLFILRQLFTDAKTKESFLFGDFVSTTFFAYTHLCSVSFFIPQVKTK